MCELIEEEEEEKKPRLHKEIYKTSALQDYNSEMKKCIWKFDLGLRSPIQVTSWSLFCYQ